MPILNQVTVCISFNLGNGFSLTLGYYMFTKKSFTTRTLFQLTEKEKKQKKQVLTKYYWEILNQKNHRENESKRTPQKEDTKAKIESTAFKQTKCRCIRRLSSPFSAIITYMMLFAMKSSKISVIINNRGIRG